MGLGGFWGQVTILGQVGQICVNFFQEKGWQYVNERYITKIWFSQGGRQY